MSVYRKSARPGDVEVPRLPLREAKEGAPRFCPARAGTAAEHSWRTPGSDPPAARETASATAWEWDGYCVRCHHGVSLVDGSDEPETEEDALCNSCVWAELHERRRSASAPTLMGKVSVSEEAAVEAARNAYDEGYARGREMGNREGFAEGQASVASDCPFCGTDPDRLCAKHVAQRPSNASPRVVELETAISRAMQLAEDVGLLDFDGFAILQAVMHDGIPRSKGCAANGTRSPTRCEWPRAKTTWNTSCARSERPTPDLSETLMKENKGMTAEEYSAFAAVAGHKDTGRTFERHCLSPAFARAVEEARHLRAFEPGKLDFAIRYPHLHVRGPEERCPHCLQSKAACDASGCGSRR